ncbi:MAG: 16S rRNA (guanine(527)-N(7))-methyltransferase RsmG [Acidobacteriota bacterium]
MSRDPDNEFKSALEAAVAGFGLDPLTPEQTTQLVKHFAIVGQWNRRINLTRIIGAEDAAKFHYAESLFGAQFITGERTIVDIGSGAGFPAIPLAVVRPDIEVTALEANHKKSIFLIEAKDLLRLDNFRIVTARLEEFDWAGYQLLTSRALDCAEAIFPSVAERLSAKQRLMLYCSRDLVEKLEGQEGLKCRIETHPIPHSEARIIAIFTQE